MFDQKSVFLNNIMMNQVMAIMTKPGEVIDVVIQTVSIHMMDC
jgi:hypothetical protein